MFTLLVSCMKFIVFDFMLEKKINEMNEIQVLL